MWQIGVLAGAGLLFAGFKKANNYKHFFDNMSIIPTNSGNFNITGTSASFNVELTIYNPTHNNVSFSALGATLNEILFIGKNGERIAKGTFPNGGVTKLNIAAGGETKVHTTVVLTLTQAPYLVKELLGNVNVIIDQIAGIFKKNTTAEPKKSPLEALKENFKGYGFVAIVNIAGTTHQIKTTLS